MSPRGCLVDMFVDECLVVLGQWVKVGVGRGFVDIRSGWPRRGWSDAVRCQFSVRGGQS